MNRWLEQVEENIRARKLFRDGQSILIAVSGGIDSMVLLHTLHALSAKYKWRLVVAHFNHKLRGRASDADEKFVRKTAAALKLPIKTGLADVKSMSKALGISIEMTARKVRHDFFASIARELRIETVALAHHADDQVELFFLRLLRGAGGDGLSGMSPVSISPADTKVRLVRPLLNFFKTDLVAFAEENRIAFREDATNAQLDFLRNRIRHEVIPLLKKIQPGLNETILRTREIIAWEQNFVLGAALDWLSKNDPRPFDELHIAVQRMCVRLQLGALGLPPDFDLIEKLRLKPDCLVSISPKFSVVRDARGIVTRQKIERISFCGAAQALDLNKQKGANFSGTKFSWAFKQGQGEVMRRKSNREFFDADRVGKKILLRHWQPGDRFQPIGMSAPIKLQDFFMNEKVPRAQRHKRIVAEAENGEIFWIEGMRIGEKFKLTKKTNRVLRWQWSG